MRDVDHTHPFGDASAARSFERGPTVVTDGGQDEQHDERMADVDHVPPQGEGAAPAFERGGNRQSDVAANDEDVYNE